MSDEIDEYIKDIKTALGNNYYFLPIGYNFFSPSSHKDEFFTKERYDTLLNGLGSWGKRIQAPLMKTCSFQIALDYNSMEDLEKKMVVIFHILPLISSLLSTSPLITNDQVVMKSYRYWCWNQAVPSRFGISPFIGNKYISFDLYLDYLINLDCPFTIIDGKYIENRGIFAEKSIPKDRIISDWLVHMSSVYTDARIRGYIELRSCDACSPPYMKAYTAFWTGLLYNQEALDNAYSIVKNWTVTDALNTRQASVCTGVQTPILTEIILNKLDVFFKLSYTGLKVRNKLNKTW